MTEMAQRDLDAALQLLADRAQYITGANGAAIALRRSGRNDMLCRASCGSNAPELGALLSTQFGLSGESVRTGQALRCDDAERDARVNHEVCRQLGIASVVVMPVVNDEEVLGVFELFSGKANAFGERDLSALQRLSGMVETAVRMARAAENLPERLKTAESPVAEAAEGEILETEILEPEILKGETLESAILQPQTLPAEIVEVEEPVLEVGADVLPELKAAPESLAAPDLRIAGASHAMPAPAVSAAQPLATPLPDAPAPPEPVPSKKPLFWSAALNSSADSQKLAALDQSHVPPVLRNLHKCQACGFPVSEGRMLCVECEEKKWRGQLRVPRPVPPRPSASATPAVRVPVGPGSTGPGSTPGARTVAATAQSGAAVAPAAVPRRESGAEAMANVTALPAPAKLGVRESGQAAVPPLPAAPALRAPVSETPVREAVVHEAAPAATPEASATRSPQLVLSAGLEPSQSWFSRNKYIFGAILVVAAVVAAILLLR